MGSGAVKYLKQNNRNRNKTQNLLTKTWCTHFKWLHLFFSCQLPVSCLHFWLWPFFFWEEKRWNSGKEFYISIIVCGLWFDLNIIPNVIEWLCYMLMQILTNSYSYSAFCIDQIGEPCICCQSAAEEDVYFSCWPCYKVSKLCFLW